MAVWPHQHGTVLAHTEAVREIHPRHGAEAHRQAGGGAGLLRRCFPGAAQRPGHQHELLVEPVQRGLLAGMVQPEMREARAMPVRRAVHAAVERPRHRAIGDYRALFVAEVQRLADAVQVVVHVVQPEGDAVRLAAARRRLHVAVAMPVAEREIRVAVRHRPPLDVVGVQQLVVGPAAQHVGQLPGQVVRVLHAAVQAEAAGRREPMCGIAHQ